MTVSAAGISHRTIRGPKHLIRFRRDHREAVFLFAHPHMLRHACGYALANKGHDTRALQAYLGHRNIQHTVRYTELSPTRFKDFWRN
jgi:site-specific recombinase XerD